MGLSEDIIDSLEKADPTFGIPLLNFEKGKIRDYHTGGFREIDTSTAARITTARNAYIEKLKFLQDELNGFAAKGEKVDPADIKTAIRMNLSEWAKDAKVSSLFDGI